MNDQDQLKHILKKQRISKQGALINSAREELGVKEKLETILKSTNSWDVNKSFVDQLVNDHGEDSVLERVEYTKSRNPENPGSYFKVVVKDLEKNTITNPWFAQKAVEEKVIPGKVSQSVKESTNEKQKEQAPNLASGKFYPTAEENVCWYDKLTDSEKLEVFKEACLKFMWFEAHLKHNKLSVLDKEFSRSSYFILMMEIIDRADNYRDPFR